MASLNARDRVAGLTLEEMERLVDAAEDVIVRYEGLSPYDLVGEMAGPVSRLRKILGWSAPPEE